MAQQSARKEALEARLEELEETHQEAVRQASLALLQQKAEIEALKWQIELARMLALPETMTEMHKTAAPTFSRPQGGKPTEHVHPMNLALGNVKEWCRQSGVQYPRARRWYEGTAPIPRRWAIYFEKKYKIAPTAWKGGISDHPLAGVPKDQWPTPAKPARKQKARKSA